MDKAIAAWRRERRTALLARRQTMTADFRRGVTGIVTARLDAFVEGRDGMTIGLYWPIKLEINLLPWAHEAERRHGLVLCLPVAVTRGTPLEYWRWSQGEPLGRGIWDIPVPARRDVALPDLMLAPLVGFDRANYRLGYGGGYFDRTLASLASRPMVVGIGYEYSALETIFPQPHDIPMDGVLTEQTDTLPKNWRIDAD
jgi:5,10-methenyltetrahydrofolate synthetase